MNPRIRLVMVAGGVLGVGIVAYFGYQRFYAKPAAELRSEIEAANALAGRYEDGLGIEAAVRRELGAIIEESVAGDRDSIEHRLRTACTALAIEAGLTNLEVNSRPPRALGNPAGSARGVTDRRFQRTLRDRIDASEARVVLDGRGTLDQVLRALALAESQPWVLGVENWSINEHRVSEGETALFALSMTMSVLLVEDDGAIAGEIPIEPLGEGVRERVATLVEADPFRTAPAPRVAAAPPPPPPAPEPEAAPPPPPPPPPGQGWRLAGIIEGSSGQYAIVVHQDGAQRTLVLGEEVGGLRLAGIGAGVAMFEISDEQYEVRNGEPLARAGRRERP